MASRARYVRIDDDKLCDLAERLQAEAAGLESVDPVHQPLATPEATLAFVVTLDAVNFGSGWVPLLRKADGFSGYFTIASALRRRFELEGAFTPSELVALRGADCARIFGQDLRNPQVAPLMELYAQSLAGLGRFIDARCGGGFEGLVAAAGGSAERLVLLLAEMPFYRDVSQYAGFRVPLYKRAQITASDLALVFAGRGPGRLGDLDCLTIFADNLVPHVLRCEGVLRYERELLQRIEAGALLPAGSDEEVEIRAVALHAVERMVAHLAAHAGPTRVNASGLDQLLWNRGHRPAIKSRKRHRTRTVFY